MLVSIPMSDIKAPGRNDVYRQFMAVIPLLVLLFTGCGNPFTQCYSGQTLTQLDMGLNRLSPPAVIPEVALVADVNLVVTERMEDGWIVLGESGWVGASYGSEAEAREHAKSIGASLVVWGYSYINSSTSAMPITLPTTTTTSGSGTVYSPNGSAGWNGSATSYGTTTTYVPITVSRYEVIGVFLAKRAKPPMLGVKCHRMTPQEQQQAGRNSGLIVELILKGSPAAHAGMLPGDVLVRVGNVDASEEEAFSMAVDANAGQVVEIEWVTKGKTMKQMVKLNP